MSRIKFTWPAAGLILCFYLLIISSCNTKEENIYTVRGEAQGTTYQVSYHANEVPDLQKSLDSIFRKIDSSLSTYLPSSIVSRINENDQTAEPDDHFLCVFRKSLEVSEKTHGAFDVTVAPLVNAWGFGFSKKSEIDSLHIDSLLKKTGFEKVKLIGNKIENASPGIMLDFNAIAQGYTIDVVAGFLDSTGIHDYFIELGGEVKAKGNKGQGSRWRVGIDKPEDGIVKERHLQAILSMTDESMATSGNYRKYYEQDGKKYSHIIDPATGYPAENNLLSVSVITTDCMTADAYATAFMVMGLEKAKEFITENKQLRLEVFFIYNENGIWKNFATEGIKDRLEELN